MGPRTTLNVSECEFVGNLDSGIHTINNADTFINVDRCKFLDNKAQGNGGAIYANNNATVNITNSTFEGNSSADAPGDDEAGAICLRLGSSGTISNNLFLNNYAFGPSSTPPKLPVIVL